MVSVAGEATGKGLTRAFSRRVREAVASIRMFVRSGAAAKAQGVRLRVSAQGQTERAYVEDSGVDWEGRGDVCVDAQTRWVGSTPQ